MIKLPSRHREAFVFEIQFEPNGNECSFQKMQEHQSIDGFVNIKKKVSERK